VGHSRSQSRFAGRVSANELQKIYSSEYNYSYESTMDDNEKVLPFDRVTTIYVDSNNDLWAGTELGIYVFELD